MSTKNASPDTQNTYFRVWPYITIYSNTHFYMVGMARSPVNHKICQIAIRRPVKQQPPSGHPQATTYTWKATRYALATSTCVQPTKFTLECFKETDFLFPSLCCRGLGTKIQVQTLKIYVHQKCKSRHPKYIFSGVAIYNHI